MTAPDTTTARPEPVVIPPYLVGETVALLVMTAHGSHVADAEIVAVAPHGDGYTITAHMGAERGAFALVPIAQGDDADPMSRACDDCGAEPGEPCTWPCASHMNGGATGSSLSARPDRINR